MIPIFIALGMIAYGMSQDEPKKPIKRFAKGGNIYSEIDTLYKKSGFINDDYNWKNKLLEMLEDSSVEAYQIYQKLNVKEKKDVLQELFEMENDMGADGDGKMKTSKSNLAMFLEESKNGKKYSKGGNTSDDCYIEYLNKDKGFQKDIKKFKSYESAVKWGKKNFERFNYDMIKYKR